MARILVAVLVLAAVLGVGAVAVRQWLQVSSTSAVRPLENRQVTVAGRPVTCHELVPGGCDFDLQFAFDRWGGQLDSFAAADLGPWGRALGVGPAAELGLLACNTAAAWKTFLDYLDAAQSVQPGASGPELFPFWDQARRLLCPESG